jgi:hypothetical protein
MMLEAQSVVAMRVAGMVGLWDVTPAEDARMVREKSDAAAESARAMTRVALAGGTAGAAALAGLEPLRRRTQANAKRLALRGPKLTHP